MNLLRLLNRKTFPHGIHPPQYKEETRDKPTRRLAFPEQVILPLQQNIGAPSIAIVRKGQMVERGELIAIAAPDKLSVPLHASVEGTVRDITLMPTATGPKTRSSIIQTLPSSPQIPVTGEQQDYRQMSREEIIAAIRDMGMVGLGGAEFPTYAKLATSMQHDIHTVIANGCECEPFITTDFRVMLENVQNLLLGMRIVMKAVAAEKGIIAIEDNKLEVMTALQAHLPEDGSIKVEVVETKYPQGAEQMLIYSLLGVALPKGKLPASLGLEVINVATAAEIGALLPNGQGFIERTVTITGDDLENPGNYRVPIGTSLQHILDETGFVGEEAELILGGPMMGQPVAFLDTPVHKGTGAVLVLDERATPNRNVQPCIKCAMCVEACPIHLNPSALGLLAYKHRYQEMQEQFHLNNCFECGSCSFVCPSNIPLVQLFRVAKAMNRERKLQ